MRGVVVALGNFDGVHLGHQAVLRRAVEVGRDRGERVAAATFDPHPQAVLRRGGGPPLLTTLELRRDALMRYGADEMRVIRFDEELSRKSPEEFVEGVLLNELSAGVVVVGENFRFGHKAAGDVRDLARLMCERGGDVVTVPLSSVQDREEISSTRIRAMISEGRVREAASLLGRPYMVRGEVVEGEHRGTTIGFPTANVVPDSSVVVPARGVYAGYASAGGRRYAACTNIGVAPTFQRAESKIETYLLDFSGDLYGSVVDIEFIERIREEKRFSGIEELKGQISRDVEETRLMVGDRA